MENIEVIGKIGKVLEIHNKVLKSIDKDVMFLRKVVMAQGLSIALIALTLLLKSFL